MKNKKIGIKGVMLLLLVIIVIGAISMYAWAKYMSSKTGSAEASLANWHFELKNLNGETMSENGINFPITRTDSNTSVDAETIAPGTYGMFHVIVDTTRTEVSLYYDLDINIDQCPENLEFYQSRSELEDPKTFDDLDKLNEFLVKEAQEIQDKQENNSEDPEHKAEVYKKDSTKKAMSKENNMLSIKRFMAINDDGTKNEDGTDKSLAGKVYLETIYWEWPFQTGKVDKTTGIASGDLIDSESMGKTVTMSIALTGIQMDREIDPYRSTILLAGPTFNAKLRELAGANIEAFIKSPTEPNEEQKNNENIISISGSKYPVYAWYDNGNIYYWSEAENIYMNKDSSYMFSNMRRIEQIDVSKFDTSNVTTMTRMFWLCQEVRQLDLSNFDTRNVRSMQDMFQFCSKLTSLDVSSFDTRNVTNMSNMFSLCNSVRELDVSKFDTSNVTSMSSMFSGCGVVSNLDVSGFDTSNVTSMAQMFENCGSVTELDVSRFDTRNVTSMEKMFASCINVSNLDVSRFDTGKVTNMANMFYRCINVRQLDLSNFDTRNVRSMQTTFQFCYGLRTIYVSDKWTMQNVTIHESMFGVVQNLKGGAGTTYNSAHVDGAYAHVDGGEENPGYFTLKTN